MTIKQHLRIPPFAYRLLAKVRVNGKTFRPLTLTEIITRSGLPRKAVIRLSDMMEWDDDSLAYADRFITACGYDPFRQKRAREHLKRIFASLHGLAGTRQFHQTKALLPRERADRARYLERLTKILTK